MARVLVVEDDPDIRQLVELRLRGLGHRVVSAPSGAEALAVIAERGAPEVVVLDVAMPGMTGLEVLRTLRAQPETADLPAIFLSARVRPEDIAAGEELGAVYLTKPFVVSALAGAIDKALQAEAHAAGGW
ncbi:response regulator [Kineococcus sp. DHX-1]|uniref:response regulator n=1 Tax=Kineococcus sp. DHX-1 TaxID=3349638 RepID=UPI0036D2A342